MVGKAILQRMSAIAQIISAAAAVAVGSVGR